MYYNRNYGNLLMVGRWLETAFIDTHYNLKFGDLVLVHTEKNETQRTDSAILERFSSEELWILSVKKKCQEGNLPVDKCNVLKARECYDEWFQSCD